MTTKVVFVCTGNLCRSPMAEGLMRHKLSERGCSDVDVSSVGTWAYTGQAATRDAIATLEKRGIDLSTHMSRAVDVDELEAADIIVAMTSVHVREIGTLAPHLIDRLVLLKELREIRVTTTSEARADRIRALLTGERPPRRRALDVDDPMGLPIGAYERTASELETGIEVLLDILCPEGSVTA